MYRERAVEAATIDLGAVVSGTAYRRTFNLAIAIDARASAPTGVLK
jgi:hypothetical protein